MSYTTTKSTTFTITHARYLASKIAADMHMCGQFYGKPREQQIRDYAEELAQYINAGYLREYEFGYKKDDKRVVTWRYTVDSNGLLTTDDRPGKVVAYVAVSCASFFTFLTWNVRFATLSDEARDRFTSGLPIRRKEGNPPADGNGFWTSDRNYYSSGQGLGRQTFQPFA